MSLSPFRLDDYVAGELDAADAARTRAHLAACGRCRREARLLEEERALFRARRASLRGQLADSEALCRRLTAARARSRARSLAFVASAALAAAALSWALAPQVVRLRGAREQELASPVLAECGVSACCDEQQESIAELERLHRACLVATPAGDML